MRFRIQELRRASLLKRNKDYWKYCQKISHNRRKLFHKELIHDPFTSVGDCETIENSSIEYCLTLRNTMISNVERLEERVIGEFARIVRVQIRDTGED